MTRLRGLPVIQRRWCCCGRGALWLPCELKSLLGLELSSDARMPMRDCVLRRW